MRHLSSRLTPVLLTLPITANQVTLASIALGIACAALLATGGQSHAVAGASLLVIAYVLDNCDGEIARARRTTSRLGQHLDTGGDVLVHTALFACLGAGLAARTGSPAWAWLGGAAAAGSAINGVVSLQREYRQAAHDALPQAPCRPAAGEGPAAWALYVFRELFRADFCFVVLLLAALDALWLLLVTAAVGAQVYWIAGLGSRASRYHA